MNSTLEYFELLLLKSYQNILALSSTDLELKENPGKWSKKEILGHLIDSAIYNLQRFTEVQFKGQPFVINTYQQNELIIVNQYQSADSESLIQLWYFTNKRILDIVSLLTKKQLELQVVLSDNQTESLAFLVKDYVTHLEHHLHQIIE